MEQDTQDQGTDSPKTNGKSKLRVQVSAKGAVSVYGLGRFPVTLYQSQWEALFAHRQDVEACIAANGDSLATKPKAVTKADLEAELAMYRARDAASKAPAQA